MHLRYLFLIIFFTSSLFAQQKPVVILELFTSQGCSSCPPADDFLSELKKSKNAASIIALSYHVDYWDYIGWKDPYASKKYTNKQRFYGQKFYSSSIYTPQLVINGNEHLVGSDKVNILRKTNEQLHEESNNSIIISSAIRKNNTVEFSYDITGKINKKNIHYLLVIDERKTSVKKGENSNRTLKNSNIVVNEEIEAIKTKTGNYTLEIPSIVTKQDTLKIVVLISDQKLSMQTGAELSL